MSKREKLIERFRTVPSDFTWLELRKLLKGLGYAQVEGDGSRVCFEAPDRPAIRLHKPHPKPVVKRYALRQVKELLESEGLI